MSETSPAAAAAAPHRKPSTNKNIKKLRTISAVCSLARSWQQWVSENEDKQASEPTGWAPDSVTGPGQELKKPDRLKAAAAKPTVNREGPEDEGETPADTAPSGESRIKTKQVVKTVTSSAQERSAGIGLLTERICKDPVPSSGEEIDRILSKGGSPTRRRKCTNVVSSMTRSLKEVSSGKRQGAEEGGGGGLGEGRTCSVDTEDSGYSEAEERGAEVGGGRTDSAGAFGEAEPRGGAGAPPDVHDEPSARIKRPSVALFKKEAEDIHRINTLSKKYSAVGSLKSRWANWASDHTETQKLNPFSEEFDYEYSMSTRLRKGEEGYGRPKEGTKTAERAKRAEQHIHREIDDMCYVIRTMSDPDPDGKTRITFGELFDRYVRISDKVVGILMRARKHGKLKFEGEMLWQGQDDAVVITLLV